MSKVILKSFRDDKDGNVNPLCVRDGFLLPFKKIGFFGKKIALIFLPILFAVNATALQFQSVPYTYGMDDFADFNVRVPIEAPPGIKGNRPDIAFEYNSDVKSSWPGSTVGANSSWANWMVSGVMSVGACEKKKGSFNAGQYYAIFDDSNTYGDRMLLGVGNKVDIGSYWTLSATVTNIRTTNTWRTLFRGFSGDHQIIVDANGNLGSYGNNVSGFNGFVSSGYNVSAINDGQPHTITAMGKSNIFTDNGYVGFYVDGTYVGSIQQRSTSDVYSIGNFHGGSNQRFADRIENVQIHTTNLSDEQIARIAQGEVITDSLAAHFDFEGANDTERFSDKSGNGRDAQVNGVSIGTYPNTAAALCLHNGHSETVMKPVTRSGETFYVADGIDRDVSTDLRLYHDPQIHPTYGSVSYRLEDRDTGSKAYFEGTAYDNRYLVTHQLDRFDNDMEYSYTTALGGARVVNQITYGGDMLQLNFDYYPSTVNGATILSNLPGRLRIRSKQAGYWITAQTYMLNREINTHGGTEYLEHNRIGRCVGLRTYSATATCNGGVGDALDLVYLAPSNNHHQAGMGGLSKVYQYMGSTSKYKETHFRIETYTAAIRDRHPDAKLRRISQLTSNTNVDYLHTWYDFASPRDHPSLLGKKLYTSVYSTDFQWSPAGNHHRVHHNTLVDDVSSPHFGLVESTEVYLSNKQSPFESGLVKLHTGKSSYTYHPNTRMLANAVQEYYFEGAKVDENTVKTNYTLSNNLGTESYPIYKLGEVTKSVPAPGMLPDGPYLNTTTQYDYYPSYSTDGNALYISSIQKSSCEASTQTEACSQTGKQQSFVYNTDGSLQTVTNKARLGDTGSAVDVLRTTFTYASNGSGNVVTKEEEDLVNNITRTINTEYESDNITVDKVTVGPLVTYYGSENYLYPLGKYTKYTRATRNDGSETDASSMSFTYDGLGRLKSTTTDGVTMTRQVQSCAAITCDRSTAAYRETQTFSDSVTPDGYVEYDESNREIRTVREVDLDGSGKALYFVDEDGNVIEKRPPVQFGDETGHVVTRNVTYSRHGRLLQEDLPFNRGDSASGHTAYVYKPVYGQLSKVTAPSGEEKTYTYALDGPHGNIKMTETDTDADGSTRLVTEQYKSLLGTRVTIEKHGSLSERVDYRVDVGGSGENFARKVTISRTNGDDHEIFSDQLGNAYKEISETHGTTTRKHSVWGELIENSLLTPDGEEQKSVYSYYPEGRLQTATETHSGSPISTTNYRYDDCTDEILSGQANIAGKPCFVERTDHLTGTTYRRASLYNNKGQVSKRAMQTTVGSTAVQYDIIDTHTSSQQVDERTYQPHPDLIAQGIEPFTIKYEYGALGALHKIRNKGTNELIWEYLDKQPGGEIKEASLDNDGLRVLRDFEADSGRLTSTQLKNQSNAAGLSPYRTQTYFYEHNASEISKREDTGHIAGHSGAPIRLLSEVFTYDDSNQLEKQQEAQTEPSNLITNRTYERSFNANGDIDWVKNNNGPQQNYTYGTSNGFERLTSVGNHNLDYDLNGLLTSSGGAISPAITAMTYANGFPEAISATNRLVTVSYDSDGRVGRIEEENISTSEKAKTLFFNNEVEHRDVGDKIFVRYYIYAAAEGLHAPIASYVQDVNKRIRYATTTIIDTNFENGVSGWTNNATKTTNRGDTYLGGFGNTNTTAADTQRTFNLPAETDEVTITFDFLRIDGWDGDHFYVYVNGTQLDLGTFRTNQVNAARSGSTGNISWSLSAGSPIPGGSGNGADWSEEIHEVTITVTNPATPLTIGFGSSLNSASTDESWGIDNLNITASEPGTGPNLGLIIEGPDDIPDSATQHGTWDWQSINPSAKAADSNYHTDGDAPGSHQHYLTGLDYTIEGDSFSSLVYLAAGTGTLQYQIQIDGNWDHRIHYRTNSDFDSPSTYYSPSTYMGALPATGQWLKLNVNLSEFGINVGEKVTGIAWGVHNGQAWHDRTIVGVVADQQLTFVNAKQKDTYQDNETLAGAYLAIDGITNGEWMDNGNSVTATKTISDTWWQGDFGALKEVNSVTLYNRINCCADRLDDFYILVTNDDVTGQSLAEARASASVEIYEPTPVPSSSSSDNSRTYNFPEGARGRYITIYKAANSHLSLAEVVAIGSDVATGAVTWVTGYESSFSYVGSRLTKTDTSNSWNKGTFSNESFINDGGVYFEATETNKHRMIGLSDTDQSQSWDTIDYAIYLREQGDVLIYQNGSNKGNFGAYQTGDVFSAQRVGTEIRYYKNNQLLYTSTVSVAAATPLHVDTAFYSTGGTITNVKLKVDL